MLIWLSTSLVPVTRRLSALCVSALCLSGLPIPASAAATSDAGVTSMAQLEAEAAQANLSTALHVVVLRDAPLASYRGGVPGYDATTPPAGRRFNASRPAIAPYRGRLLAAQQSVLAAIGNPATVYSYTTALNGFAAELTSWQVKLLKSMSAVLTVEPERDLHLDSALAHPQRQEHASRSSKAGEAAQLPARLRQAWRVTGGVSDAGGGVVIGVVDSGIWPENPSFDAAPLDQAQRRTRFPGFTGSCDRGERWVATTCTEKVLAARYFVEGFGRSQVAAGEYISARDGSGHGSHVAATAAGNAGVDVLIEGQKFGRVSGMAPGASLAIYKACWTAPDPHDDGCSSADVLKAIDIAVSDGVDVLNYSISAETVTRYATSESAPLGIDAIELAFLHAANAGVLVVASAGDRGPAPATVTSSSPWVTTVAATTQGSFEGRIRLENGRTMPGSIVSDERTPSLRLVDAAQAATPPATRREAALCTAGSLDAAKVKGALVLCDRGSASRLSKSMAVSQAGGAAMVLANDQVGHTYADVHSVPTLHVTRARGKAIAHYIASLAAPRAALLPASDVAVRSAEVADFSSRGPAPDDGLLKPDIAAPGASVVAAVAPPSNLGRLWDLHSGTSMAAPQVSGVAALALSERPGWPPAVVRSALMTSAHRLSRASPFDQGAGELDPLHALDPGLVYDTDPTEWGRYQNGNPVEASDLNAPSIAIGSLVGDRVVTRSVTNVSGSRETFVARRSGLHGIGVAVSPPSLTLEDGETQSFRVSFSARSSASYGEYAFGALTWTGSRGHLVESPAVIRPEHASAPLEAHGTTTATVAVPSRAGVTGTVRTSLVGPVGARPVSLRIRPQLFDSQSPTAGSGAAVQSFVVPERSAAVRFEATTESGKDDVDLHIYRAGRLLLEATGDSGEEELTITDPDPGAYEVYVSAPPAATPGATTEAPADPSIPGQERIGVNFTGWVLPASAKAPVSLQPVQARVTGGRRFSVEVDATQLTRSQRWFGVVQHDKSSDVTYLILN